jgi:hypothetical protein
MALAVIKSINAQGMWPLYLKTSCSLGLKISILNGRIYVLTLFLLKPMTNTMEDFNPIDHVAYAIDQQTSVDITDLRRKQARAAMEAVCDILERAIKGDDDFEPDAYTIINAMRLIARTPSEFIYM